MCQFAAFLETLCCKLVNVNKIRLHLDQIICRSVASFKNLLCWVIK